MDATATAPGRAAMGRGAAGRAPGSALLPALVSAVLAAVLAAALGLAWSPPASAALAPRGGAPKPEDAFNPKPDDRDLALPMPCGMSMVFRLAALPVDGRIKDLATWLGADDEGPAAYLDRRHQVHLGSALTLDDLPDAWRKAAEASLEGMRADQIYLMGKYEVTSAQWDAVMSDACPAMAAGASGPKTDVSWFEAVDFTARYMEWLLDNHPRSLPGWSEGEGARAFLRLPTEEEWEYAARGGHRTTTDAMKSAPFFEMADGLTEADYGLFKHPSRNYSGKPDPVGRWEPNPLGLYDTVGNVAEMTLSSFRMTVGTRLHGAAGGFVRKGGSFSDEIANVMPGKRVESALYFADGPTSASNLGFRLAVSAYSATGDVRLDSLRREWEAVVPPPSPRPSASAAPTVRPAVTALAGPLAWALLSAAAAPAAGPLAWTLAAAAPSSSPVDVRGLAPVQIVDALAAATEDPVLLDVYASLRGDLAEMDFSAAWEADETVRNNCRSLIYVVYTMRNTSDRLRLIESTMGDQIKLAERLRADLTGSGADRAQLAELRAAIAAREKAIGDMRAQLADFRKVLDAQFAYYLELLGTLAELDAADRRVVDVQMEFLAQDIKGRDLYSEAMRRALAQVGRDVGRLRDGRASQVTMESILAGDG